MAKDPVCGMDVDETSNPPTSIRDGETVYFCSAACKRAYDADPAAYPA